MRMFFGAGLIGLLIAAPAFAQTIGQQAPGQGKPESATAKPAAGGTSKAQTSKQAPASTPESRSAAELALSADPVFDDGTYLRIKQTLFSYSDVEVRGGWPTVPPDAMLAPGGSGAAVAVLRRHLVITGDLPAIAELGDSYDEAVVAAVKKFQQRVTASSPAAASARRRSRR